LQKRCQATINNIDKCVIGLLWNACTHCTWYQVHTTLIPFEIRIEYLFPIRFETRLRIIFDSMSLTIMYRPYKHY